jgi:hypothetical protein
MVRDDDAQALCDAHTAPRSVIFWRRYYHVPNGALAGPGRPKNLANSLAVTLSLN